MNWDIFAKNLFVHELVHGLVALLISIFIYWKFKSKKLVLVVFLVSYLIDVDHFFEGFFVYGFNIFKILTNFRGNYFREAQLIILPFHSWEFLPVILWLGKKYNFWPLALSIVLASTGHYLFDNLVYSSIHQLSIFEYSLIYRLINNFNYWKLCGSC